MFIQRLDDDNRFFLSLGGSCSYNLTNSYDIYYFGDSRRNDGALPTSLTAL
jgi:hypothetical protein